MNSKTYLSFPDSFKRIVPRSLFAVILALFMIIGLSSQVVAQCAPLPTPGFCSGGNGTATDGVNINSNESFWFSGTGTFSNGVNLNGGTLRVCGNLTLNSMNYNGGNIIIESGGSLTINGGGNLNMNGTSLISNSGTLTINRSIVMQNSNNIIFNANPSAVLNLNGGSFSIDINSSTSTFINNGVANIHTINVQGSASAGAVCLGSGSCINLTNLNNNSTNSFTTTIGSGGISYTGNVMLNNNLTGSTGIVVCQATGSTKTGPATFGNAIVVPNCPSCSFALPVQFSSFVGNQKYSHVTLQWTTETENQNDYFTVEKSEYGNTWTDIGIIEGAGTSNKILNYSFQDNKPQNGIQFYRLKQTDFDGRFNYSDIISIHFEAELLNIFIVPNPNSTNHLNIIGFDKDIKYRLDLKNITGATLHMVYGQGSYVELPLMACGIYFLTLTQEGGNLVKTIKYIVL